MLCTKHLSQPRTNKAPQRAITRNGALWKKHRKLGVFGLPPPTARHLENWHGVVYSPGKNPLFAPNPALWRAGTVEAAFAQKPLSPTLARGGQRLMKKSFFAGGRRRGR